MYKNVTRVTRSREETRDATVNTMNTTKGPTKPFQRLPPMDTHTHTVMSGSARDPPANDNVTGSS